MPAGQREAGEVLGMTKSQIFFKITLLQMIKRIVPPMSNEIITPVSYTHLLKNFEPSLEVEEAESAIYNHDLTDVTDIITEILRDVKEKENR